MDLKDFEAHITFAEFFVVWADLNNWTVPDFHYEIIQFLENFNDWENDQAVLQIFRGAGKSTIVGLFVVWLLLNDPTLRILILSCDVNTARKITRDAQSVITRHPLARHLRGREGEWRVDSLFVRGATDKRNYSLQALGITSNITGSRADFIIFDDVEVPRTSRTDNLREDLRVRISDTVHVLVPGGKRLFIGTPHAFDSIYPEFINKGASSLTIPLLTEIEGEFPYLKGKSTWPERFNENIIIERQLNSKSKNEFYSQYQLIPSSVDDSIFDLSLLKTYREEIEFYTANKTHYAKIGDYKIISVSAFWDVSVLQSQGDDSVLAIIFLAENGHIFIHRTVAVNDEDVDKQCEKVKELLVEFNVPLVIVETNGVGAFVPQILLKHVRGLGIGVDGQPSTKNKAERIIEAFSTPLAGGFLHAHQSVVESKFLTQLRDFKPVYHKYLTHDDFIDAPASAILKQPIRIGKGPMVAKHQIKRLGGEQIYEAEMQMTTLG